MLFFPASQTESESAQAHSIHGAAVMPWKLMRGKKKTVIPWPQSLAFAFLLHAKYSLYCPKADPVTPWAQTSTCMMRVSIWPPKSGLNNADVFLLWVRVPSSGPFLSRGILVSLSAWLFSVSHFIFLLEPAVSASDWYSSLRKTV